MTQAIKQPVTANALENPDYATFAGAALSIALSKYLGVMRETRAKLQEIERDAVAHRESGSAEPWSRVNEMDAEITRHRHAWRQITTIKQEMIKLTREHRKPSRGRK